MVQFKTLYCAFSSFSGPGDFDKELAELHNNYEVIDVWYAATDRHVVCTVMYKELPEPYAVRKDKDGNVVSRIYAVPCSGTVPYNKVESFENASKIAGKFIDHHYGELDDEEK